MKLTIFFTSIVRDVNIVSSKQAKGSSSIIPSQIGDAKAAGAYEGMNIPEY